MADHNNKQRAAENVRVVLRCRPLNGREQSGHESEVVKCHEKKNAIEVALKTNKNFNKTFWFDNVFGPVATQRDIYVDAITPIVEEVLNGYNCTIFAYGQTGTGKTYTMEGLRTNPTGDNSVKQRWRNNKDAGIISRSVEHIFDSLQKSQTEYAVRVSHMELYKEELCDLLNPGNTSQLKLYEEAGSGRVYVHNLEETNVYSPEDIFSILEKSYEERRTAETNLNKNSSRSHCIFSITIHTKEVAPDGEDLIKVGKLNLVDLAGSENIGRSGADKDILRTQEASKINKSLLTLGRVITALTDGAPHIPYRESKLTRLLQDSLGGSTKTCIIATISPAEGCLEETLSTLEYAFRAKNIRNRPEVNQKLSKREVIVEYTSEIRDLKTQLEAMRRQNGVYLPVEKFTSMEEDIKTSHEKIQELEDLIERKTREMEEQLELFNKTSAQLDRTEKKLQDTEDDLKLTTNTLKTTENILEATKETLEEHKYFVQEHETTEGKFHQEANELLGTINESVLDVDALHAKIGRLDSLGTGNHQAAKSFQEQVKGRVQTAENKLNHFIAEQTRKFAELHSSIDAFVGQKDAEVEQVQRNIINLENLVIGHVQSIGKIAATYSADAAGKLDHYESSQDYHQEEFERKINAFTSDIRESFGQLGETIRLHRASVASWTAEKKQAIEANINTARYFIEKNNEKISEIASMADDHSIRQVASLYAHQESLADFLENQVAQSNKFQNDLIAQVTDMIVGFVRKQNESTSTVVGSIKSALAASQKETTAFKTGIDAKTDSAKFSATQFSNEFSKTQTDLIDSITQQDVNAGSFSVVVVDKIENLHSNVDTQSQCVIQHGRKRVGDLKKYVDVIKSSTAGFMSDHAAKVEQTLLDSSTQIETDLVESLRRHQTSMKEWLNNYNSEVSTTKCVSESFGADYNEYSHFTREQIAAFGLQEYAPTGATPQKKHYEHPTNLARTKPKHVLVQEYRRLKLSGGVNLSSMDNIDSIDQLPSTISSLHSSVDESGSGVASEDENPLADEVSSNGSTGSSISMKETPPVAVSAKAATIIPGKMLPPTMPAKAAAKKSATAAVEVKRVASSTSMATQNQLVKNSSGALAKKPSNTTIVNKKPALQRSASKTTLGDATNKL